MKSPHSGYVPAPNWQPIRPSRVYVYGILLRRGRGQSESLGRCPLVTGAPSEAYRLGANPPPTGQAYGALPVAVARPSKVETPELTFMTQVECLTTDLERASVRTSQMHKRINTSIHQHTIFAVRHCRDDQLQLMHRPVSLVTVCARRLASRRPRKPGMYVRHHTTHRTPPNHRAHSHSTHATLDRQHKHKHKDPDVKTYAWTLLTSCRLVRRTTPAY